MNCYIKLDDNGLGLPKGINKDNALFFPERGMSTRDLLHTCSTDSYHVITQSPFIIPLYKKEEVFIQNSNGEWGNVGFQTYGASYDTILNEIWETKYSTASSTIDGYITNCLGRKIK
jgi:hypothetical protein